MMADYRHIEALDRASGGRAIMVPTLADLLAERGCAWPSRPLLHPVPPSSGRHAAVSTRSTRTRPTAAPIFTRYATSSAPRPMPMRSSRQHLNYAARAVTALYLDDDEIRGYRPLAQRAG